MGRFRANVKKLQVIKTCTARSYFIEHFISNKSYKQIIVIEGMSKKDKQ